MDQTSDNGEVNFETVLNNEIGEIGRYQIRNILLMSLVGIASGLMAGDYVFTAARLPYRCAVPECDLPQPQFAPDWLSHAVPSTTTGFADCVRHPSLNITTAEHCPAVFFNQSATIPCESYVYERTNSVVFDFHLECQEWLRALLGTLNSLGAMIALPLAGYVSDYFGRRVSVALFLFNIALVGVVRAFSVNYVMYATLQFMQTAIGGGAFSAAYILATEIVGPHYRVRTSAAMSSSFAMGQVFLGLIASAVYEWRKLTLVMFTPVFILVSYYWLLDESHRWLLSKSKEQESRAALERAARLNRRTISEKNVKFLLTAIPKQNGVGNENQIPLVSRVLRSPVMLRRCCVTPVMWISTTFIYYGLSINSVGLSGNMYINYIAIALVEIPGFWTAVLVLDKVGRKITLFSGYFICGVCCIAFAFTSRDRYVLSLVLYLIGKYCIGLVFTSVYLFTSELYPTRHRHSFLGYSSMLGRVGSVVAPLTPPLMVYWVGLPSMLFGGMSVFAGLLVLTQPETKGFKVPDTFEDAENIGREK